MTQGKFARVLVAVALMGLSCPAEARVERSAAAVREFRRAHLCPSTGLKTGPCPGWIVDHLWPLCAGGADKAWQMQWQSEADAKRKDRNERFICSVINRK
jgi:hypothetical protein